MSVTNEKTRTYFEAFPFAGGKTLDRGQTQFVYWGLKGGRPGGKIGPIKKRLRTVRNIAKKNPSVPARVSEVGILPVK